MTLSSPEPVHRHATGSSHCHEIWEIGCSRMAVRLYLLGDAKGPLHAAGWLGLDGQVGGATSAPHRPAAPMEQRHLHPRLLAHLRMRHFKLKLTALKALT